MTFTAVVLATLMLVPGSEAADVDEEPGAARVVQRTPTQSEKPRWLPDAEEDARIEEVASRSKVAPAVVLGLSVVAGIAGTVFLMKTMDALDRADATLGNGLGGDANGQSIPVINPEALREQQRDVLTNGIATTTLLSASIAGLVTSTVLLISD